jgi:hypothetical protein
MPRQCAGAEEVAELMQQVTLGSAFVSALAQQVSELVSDR